MLPEPLRFFLFFLLLLAVRASFSQPVDCEPQDKIVFGRYKERIEPFRSKSKEVILQQTAEFFLNAPYVAGTLDKNDTERLVINLREFDCVTFVETVIALANTAVSDDLSFDNFAARLKQIRYRNGVAGGYDSRLHYTTDWVYDNVEKKILSEISRQLGGVPETKTIDFMTSHRAAYRALKTDDEMLGRMRDVEEAINARGGFYYLPKEKIGPAEATIPHMAVIAFATSIKGLDVTHTAFAYKKNGVLTFIHASSAKKRVVVDEKTLSGYGMAQKSCTGIRVMPVR